MSTGKPYIADLPFTFEDLICLWVRRVLCDPQKDIS
jgi:hypothetical protein